MLITRQNLPASFRLLRQDLQNKAIITANRLLEAGYPISIAELIAYSSAKFSPNDSQENKMGANRKNNLHLIPHPKGWALIPGDASSFYFIIGSKRDALFKARILAKNDKLKLYIHSPAGNISDSESFVVNRPVIELSEPVSVNKQTEETNAQPIRESLKRTSVIGKRFSTKWMIVKKEIGKGTSLSLDI
jgi:hypothetical protein